MENIDDILVDSYEVFAAYADQQTNKLPIDNVKKCVRSLRFALTEQEFDELMQKLPQEGLTLEQYIEMVKLLHKEFNIDPYEELYQALRVFDPEGEGFVKVSDLTYAMTTIGETMDVQQVQQALQQLSRTPDNRVDIKELVHMLCRR